MVKPRKWHALKPRSRELAPFLAFWDGLDNQTQSEFEKQAMDRADPIKRRWYDDAQSCGRDTANYFRLAILNDHFRRTSDEIATVTAVRARGA